MSFRSVKPTQPELARLKRRNRFLIKGRDLLEIKRQQLFDNLKSLGARFFKLRKELVNLMQVDFKNLQNVYEIFGKDKFSIIAQLNKSQCQTSVDVRYLHKMGVDVPEVKLVMTEGTLPVYSFSDTPIHLDVLLSHMKKTISTIIKFAELDNLMYSFAMNYQKIQRRINSLEDFIIPRLDSDIKMIQDILEDLEQEEFVQLKKIKEFLENKDLTEQQVE